MPEDIHSLFGHYKIFCVNGKYGIQHDFRIFYSFLYILCEIICVIYDIRC